MARGLYGQNEGNESRGSTAVLESHFRANEICEGEEQAYIAQLMRAIVTHCKSSNFTAVQRAKDKLENYLQSLRAAGWSETRLIAMQNGATRSYRP